MEFPLWFLITAGCLVGWIVNCFVYYLATKDEISEDVGNPAVLLLVIPFIAVPMFVLSWIADTIDKELNK